MLTRLRGEYATNVGMGWEGDYATNVDIGCDRNRLTSDLGSLARGLAWLVELASVGMGARGDWVSRGLR